MVNLGKNKLSMLNSASPFSSWKWATLREHAFCYYPMNTACEISLFHFGIQLNRLIWFSFYVVSSDLTSKSNEVDISASSWYFLALIFFFFFKKSSWDFFFKFIYFIYLFLAVFGLHCYTQAFSSCSEQRLLFVAVCGLLTVVASLVAEHGL